MTWREYCTKHNTDSLYFFRKEYNHLIVVTQGTGDNLLDEDEDEGFVDYWYVKVFDSKEGEIGGGQLMLPEYIDPEQSVLDIIKYVSEHYNMLDCVPPHLNEYFIAPQKGKELEELFEKIEEDAFHLKVAQCNLEHYLKKNYN